MRVIVEAHGEHWENKPKAVAGCWLHPLTMRPSLSFAALTALTCSCAFSPASTRRPRTPLARGASFVEESPAASAPFAPREPFDWNAASDPPVAAWPSVSVMMITRARPRFLEHALAAVAAQV